MLDLVPSVYAPFMVGVCVLLIVARSSYTFSCVCPRVAGFERVTAALVCADPGVVEVISKSETTW